MARFKLLISLLVLIGVCTLAATSFAKPAPTPKCGFNGDYSFFFWDPNLDICRRWLFLSIAQSQGRGAVPALYYRAESSIAIVDGIEFEDFIEDGLVFLETDGEGTMEIETNSSDGICGTLDEPSSWTSR